MEYSDIEQLQMLIQQRGGTINAQASSKSGLGSHKRQMGANGGGGTRRPISLQLAMTKKIGQSTDGPLLGAAGDNADGEGGLTSDDFLFDDESQVDEPIYFDQTTRHMGSIQKNMVLTESHKSMLGNNGFGRQGMATKAMQGFNPASTAPNYSVMGPGGHNQATYRAGGLRNPQSITSSHQQNQQYYQVSEERIANQFADVDAPKGQDQMWQIIDTTEATQQKQQQQQQFQDPVRAQQSTRRNDQATTYNYKDGSEDEHSSSREDDDVGDDVGQEYDIGRNDHDNSFSSDDNQDGLLSADTFFGAVPADSDANGKRKKRHTLDNPDRNEEVNQKQKQQPQQQRAPSQQQREQKAVPVLTFVDMSKLKYLSRSVNQSNPLQQRAKPKQKLPKDTGSAIIEAVSEEDDDEDATPIQVNRQTSQDENGADQKKLPPKTPREIALEVLGEIVDIVLESEDANTDQNEIVTNQLLQKNIHKLHKQVFVKVKVADNPVQTTLVANSVDALNLKSFKKKQTEPKFGKGREPHNSTSFRSTVKTRQSAFAKQKSSRQSEMPQSSLMQSARAPKKQTHGSELFLNSGLAEAMENTTQHDFVIQQCEPSSRYYLKSQIYFFDSPRKLKIEIGWNELVKDVIRHIMTLYRKDKNLSTSLPLEFPDAPERYSLYFIDDDESEHAPDYEMGPRNPDEPIGEFPALAFVLNKKFKQSGLPTEGGLGGSAGASAQNQAIAALQTEEGRRDLEAKDQRLMFIECNTMLANKERLTITMRNSQQIEEIVYTLAKKVKGKIQPNPSKYIFMVPASQAGAQDGENEHLSDMFGGYNAFGQDARVIDSKTIIRNLKGDRLEVRERIFVDKPVKKQLELSLEEDGRTAGRNRNNPNQGYFSSELVAQQQQMRGMPQTLAVSGRGRDRLESVNSDFAPEEFKGESRNDKKEEDFLYGLLTSKKLQKWPVIKYNKKNKPKERILCIDGFNIYHEKTQVKESFFSSLLPDRLLKGGSSKGKPISQIVGVARPQSTSDCEFIILYREDKRQVRYKATSPSNCSEILAKLKFLRQGQSVNTNQRRMPAGTMQQQTNYF